MPARRVHAPDFDYTSLIAALRADDKLPADFSSAELAEADAAARADLPRYVDRTDIPLVTIDPPGSKDLDQAQALQRTATGYRLYYAIADVAAFVAPYSSLETATFARGVTLYFPDLRLGLHPAALSEGAASLLPKQVRPAVLWEIDVDKAGNIERVHVGRALVRSREQFDYETVQAALDQRNLPTPLSALPELGALRIARARAAGALDLRRPEQTVARHDGRWQLTFRAQLPVEEYNAHMSILTGEAAASLMLTGGIGLLRTLPRPTKRSLQQVRHGAKALGFAWPSGATVAQVLAAIDANTPIGGAFIDLAASLLRGSGYTAFDGNPPESDYHAGVGAAYAHVTAPLRRLADRFATEICLALVAGEEVPEWARARLPQLADTMRDATNRSSFVERAVFDYTEATLLVDRVGEVFPAAVVSVADNGDEPARKGTIIVDDPAVRAGCDGLALRAGDRIDAKLVTADPPQRQVRFAAV